MKRAALLFVLLTAGCTSQGLADLPPPPSTIAPLPTTTVPDYSASDLRSVPGRTTTTIPMTPGKASLNGAVVGPEGPVPGAVVHVERLVGDAAASLDVATAADGTWVLTGIIGGRYRVRAWRPQDLTLVKPEIFYLSDGEQKAVNLQLARYTGLNATFAIAPNPPNVGEPANLVVRVVQQSVDLQGVVRGAPVPGARAELFGGGDWHLDSPNPATSDANGLAAWQLTCRTPGKQALSLIVAATQQFPLDLPACVVPPPTTTSEPASTTSSSAPPSSTTSSSTTSTTKKPTTTTTR